MSNSRHNTYSITDIYIKGRFNMRECCSIAISISTTPPDMIRNNNIYRFDVYIANLLISPLALLI